MSTLLHLTTSHNLSLIFAIKRVISKEALLKIEDDGTFEYMQGLLEIQKDHGHENTVNLYKDNVSLEHLNKLESLLNDNYELKTICPCILEIANVNEDEHQSTDTSLHVKGEISFFDIKAFIFKDEISMRRTKHILKMELLDGFELVDNCNFVVDPKYFVQAV